MRSRLSSPNLFPACLPVWCLLAGYGGRVTAVPEVQYWWHEVPVPAGLEITQVYGYLLCPQTGRVLVQEMTAFSTSRAGRRSRRTRI